VEDIEAQGWIAPAECIEVRVTMTDNERMIYATAEPEERYKVCSTVHTKIAVVKSILARHPDEPTLVIGAYLDQLDELGRELDAPVIQGSTKTAERESLYDAFRRGEIRTLVVSKVANFSIDLPEASVAVQVSGTFGSRRRRRSDWAGCCAPRPTAAARSSTRWCPATAWTRSTPRTAALSRRAGLWLRHQGRRRPAGPGDMTVRRVMPIITVADLEASRDAYVAVLGLARGDEPRMDRHAGRRRAPSPGQPDDAGCDCAGEPTVSIEVDDVDAAHQAALDAGLLIVHPLSDEEWGVRRFFFADPAGNVVNVLSHRH